MKKVFIPCLICFCSLIFSQNKTDISLAWKDKDVQVESIESETGNLYKEVKHHGPAVENEWMGLRLYFDYKCAIDVYNKTRKGLELEAAGWYPTPEKQQEGWGADQYKVGKTVGLGGVRLWDGEKVVFLDPVSKRTARVSKGDTSSSMEMFSEGVPYKGDTIDVLIRVTVFSGIRAAKVEAYATSEKPVQFLTGINYHPLTETKQGENYICTWGIHPEDVAAYQLNIGAGIIYNPDDYVSVKKEEKEFQLISKPTKNLETWIVSACEKEEEINSMEKLVEYLDSCEE